MVGVFDRMEIWDREAHERFESAHARRLPDRARSHPGRDGSMRQDPLPGEVRQSLSLIAITAGTMAAVLGLGLLAARLFG